MTQIRNNHRYAFRKGQWANLTGMELFKGRQCYVVEFSEDSFVDWWVISDTSALYEFREV